MRWPTRFQRSKKGFVFWSLISGILLTQTWQRDCLRNTKSFSFIIFVSSSLLFFAGFVNVTSNIDEEDKENGFARISLLFFTISRDIKENYEAQIRPAHFYISNLWQSESALLFSVKVMFPTRKGFFLYFDFGPTPPPQIHIGLDFDRSKWRELGRDGNLIEEFIFKVGFYRGVWIVSYQDTRSTHFNKKLKLLHYSW